MKKILFLSLLSIFTLNLFCSEESGGGAAASVVPSDEAAIEERVGSFLRRLKPEKQSMKKHWETELIKMYTALGIDSIDTVAQQLEVDPSLFLLNIPGYLLDDLIKNSILKSYQNKQGLFSNAEKKRFGFVMIEIQRSKARFLIP
jgi:hypothetical protein